MTDDGVAEAWFAAWNSGDVDAILALYADELEVSSPFIAALGFARDGVLYGKAMFRAYLDDALPRARGLSLKPIATCIGARGLTMVYRNHTGVVVTETHELNAEGLIVRSDTAYESLPAP